MLGGLSSSFATKHNCISAALRPLLMHYGKSLQELQPSKESDEEGTDDGKQRDKKRKEV